MSGVYFITKDEHSKFFYTVKSLDRFTLPEKIYGNIEKTAVRVWNTFAITKKSTGILLTGNKGSGKTILGEIISNFAIDRGLPVYMVTEISITLDLVSYIRNLSHCVIFLDEFGKNAEGNVMDQMLTMFSDVTASCKLFILTENALDKISPFIRDRPGRIRYHLDFEKLPYDIYTDFLLHNPVRKEFQKELDLLYERSLEFSFDMLDTIVSEHNKYPDDSLEDLIKILNCKSLVKPMKFAVLDITLYGITLDTNSYEVRFGYYDGQGTLAALKRYPNSKDIDVFIRPEKFSEELSKKLQDYQIPSRTNLCLNDLYMDIEGRYIYKDDNMIIRFYLQ